jgi:predicted transcriptional regulator
LIVKTVGYNPTAGGDVQAGSYEGFLNAEGMRHKLARYIGHVELTTGRGPTLRQMMGYLQYNNPGWVHRSCEILAERGLLTFGSDQPTKLTQKGKDFYGVGKVKMMDTTTKDAPPVQQTVIVKQAASKPRVERKRQFYEGLTEKVGHYMASTRTKVTARLLTRTTGHSMNAVRRGLLDMMKHGLIEDRRYGSKKGLKLTAKGRQRFGVQREPKPTPAPAPVAHEAPVQPQPTRSPSPNYASFYGDDVLTTEPYEPQNAPIEQQFDEPVRKRWPTKPNLGETDTADLVMELIERGYIVKKG